MKHKFRNLSVKNRKIITGYLFVSIWIVGFILFFMYPFTQSIRLAFSNITDITTFQLSWAGTFHFSNAFVRDIQFFPLLIESTKNTLTNTPIVVIFSMFIAILLNRNIKGKGIFRVTFLLPVLLGTGVVMQTIRGNFGISDLRRNLSSGAQSANDMTVIGISEYLNTLLGPIAAEYLQNILIAVSGIIWMSGIQIILFLGALQTIPTSYYEAAVCDGASEWEKFWKITLPLTMPTILLVTVYTVIDYFTSTENTVITYITNTSFANFSLAYGSAMSWMYFSLIGIVILIIFLIMKRFTFYMGDK